MDGNGRTARVLCALILYQNGYDLKRLFSISEFYDKDRGGYYNAIQSVRDGGMDMTGWLEYFVEALKIQMLEVKERGERAIKREILMEKARKAKLNKRQENALNYILKNKEISRSEYVGINEISLRTANYDLKQMEELGFIKRTGVGRGVRYRLKLG